MQNLQQLQMDFQNFLEGKNTINIERWIVAKTPKELDKRLGIYREAYQLRLLENLRKQFPVLLNALGKAAFEVLGKQYIQAYPPDHFAIRLFGQYFPMFLKDCGEYPEYLSELATLEWAMDEALDNSAEQSIFTLEDLQEIGEEKLLTTQFYFQDSLKVLSLAYDIPALWQAVRTYHKLPKNIEAVPTYVAVWRYQWQPYFFGISEMNWNLIKSAQSGKNFTELCTLAHQNNDEAEAAAKTAEIVMGWINNHWLTKHP